MDMLITLILVTILGESFGQSFGQICAEHIAHQKLIETPVMESYIEGFDLNGDPMYDTRPVLPFNYGITPLLLDSLKFYSLRDSFIADSNLVFAELKITDFDDTYCYECDSIVNVNYDYERIVYRGLFGDAQNEDLVKNDKFIYYFVGKIDNDVYYLHALMGARRSLN